MSRILLAAALIAASAAPVGAWDTPPHRAITKAALESLPPAVAAKFGGEKRNLVDLYCILPDQYVEMEQHGFARNGPGPSSAEEIRPYCRRPDGQMVHSASFDHDEDLNTLIFLVERILTRLNEKQMKEAAMYAGVMAHWIQDSLSPPHSVLADDLAELGPGLPHLHRVLEHSVAEFAIAKRSPLKGGTLLDGLESILRRVYQGAERNRKALPEMVRAVRGNDVAVLEWCRAGAAREAAEILGDAWVLLLTER